jgi:hypothetical protein
MGRSEGEDWRDSALGRFMEEVWAEWERIRENGHGAPRGVPHEEPHAYGAAPRRLASLSRLSQRPALEQLREAQDLARGRWADTTDLMSLKRRLLQLCEYVEVVLDEIAREVGRLADEAGRLARREAVADVRRDAARAVPNARRGEAAGRGEPRFEPAERPLTVAFAEVPDFEALLEAQRALEALPAVREATVTAFEDEDGLLEVTLRAPATVREVVEGLGRGAGRQFLIEEADVAALRLRLHFIEREGSAEERVVWPERWPRQ